ncbi:MAG: hypothetical protein IPM29_06980 [Planctomycetes bacterium]|nr:hypothetical protein [Planctomycetota bacterium]
MLEVLIAERELLREELRDLKGCQVRYFSIAITSTGVLTAVSTQFVEDNAVASLFLAPLLILLPCWWIFFDKATTITRIVGYVRVLETMIIDMAAKRPSLFDYVGWENALRLARQSPERSPTPPITALWRSMTGLLRVGSLLWRPTVHRYWIVNWLTFLLLSSLCVGLSLSVGGHEAGLPVAAAVLVSGFAGATANQVIQLTSAEGIYTYDHNEVMWRSLLSTSRGSDT